MSKIHWFLNYVMTKVLFTSLSAYMVINLYYCTSAISSVDSEHFNTVHSLVCTEPEPRIGAHIYTTKTTSCGRKSLNCCLLRQDPSLNSLLRHT